MHLRQIDLQAACRIGQIDSIKQAYSENPKKLNEKDSSVILTQLGWCPLYRTVISGHHDATHFILSQGADPNNPNNLGETPLHQAADNSQYKIAELLLSFKADPNFQQKDGDSPLHHATFRGDSKMVEILLKSEADPNLQNFMVRCKQFGRTPLHYAVDCGHLECVEVMLRYGADPSLKDKQGKNAKDLSTSERICEVIDEFGRESVELDSSPIGEVTTYIVSDTSELLKRYETSPNVPLRCNVVSPVTEQSSIPQISPIFAWLEKNHLEDYYEVLIDAGYDDISLMVNQMKGPLPISDKNLRDIGICKPGHRRLFLVKLEQEAKGKIRHVREKSGTQCCVISNNEKKFTPLGMIEWLEEMELSHLYALFLEAGYDSYENLLEMQGSVYKISGKQLELEVKVKDLKARTKILERLESDAKLYLETTKEMFDEPKRVVCESCIVI